MTRVVISNSLLFRRKVPRELSWKRRHGYGQKLTSNDQVLLKKSRKLLICLQTKMKTECDNALYKRLYNICLVRHMRHLYVVDKPLRPCLPSKNLRIDKLGDDDCEV